MEHFCHWDITTWPSDGFNINFTKELCCGQPAPIKIETEPEYDIWACQEHADYYEARP
jgi:hypothetical protein